MNHTPSPSFATRSLIYSCLFLCVVAVVLLAGCGDGFPPADERIIPAQLPYAEREAARRLELSGTINSRDLGGYRTADGRRVRWGLLYRSDDLHDLDSQDRLYLQRLGIKQVVDFRSRFEQQEEPDQLPEGLRRVSYPMEVSINGQGLEELLTEPGNLEKLDTEVLMQDINRQLIREFTPLYREWIGQLAASETAVPQVFHCTAGKDRAGLGAALLLLALGVERQTVMDDYLLSARYYDAEFPTMARMISIFSLFQVDPEKLRPLLTVRRDYLEAAFAEIDRLYGSTEAYLEQGLGITRQLRRQLQNRFLEVVN